MTLGTWVITIREKTSNIPLGLGHILTKLLVTPVRRFGETAGRGRGYTRNHCKANNFNPCFPTGDRVIFGAATSYIVGNLTVTTSHCRIWNNCNLVRSAPHIVIWVFVVLLYLDFLWCNNMADNVEQLRVALQECPPGHSGRPASLQKLANSLRGKFQQRGVLSDLDEAIELYRAAVVLLPDGPAGDFGQSMSQQPGP
jgi:hypothetical protein